MIGEMKAIGGLALLTMVGCGSGAASSDGAPRPKNIYALTPDGTTNAGASLVIQFAAQYAGGGFSADDRSTVEGGLSLATWPDLSPIAGDVSLTPATSAPAYDVFAITSRAPLPDGWYIGLAASVPPDARWTSPLFSHVEADGTVGTRVRVGSAPALRRLDFCPKSGGDVAVVVTFSEPIMSTADVLPLAVAAGSSCMPPALPTAGAPLAELEYVCNGAALTDAFALALGEGLSSPSGVAVPPARAAVTPSTLPDRAGGCNNYKFDF